MTPDATGETPADAAARASAEFRADVLHGLAQTPKRIPSKYFYDARGSQLFEEICAQPEYYLTRTELAILEENAAAIASAIGPRALLVEYGSGAGIKTRLLLDALDQPVGYVPVEISRSALDASIENLSEEFPEVDMLPVSADFTRPVDLPAPDQAARRTVVFFRDRRWATSSSARRSACCARWPSKWVVRVRRWSVSICRRIRQSSKPPTTMPPG